MAGLSAVARRDIDLDNFSVNLRDFPYHFWKLLGEARSKCDHIRRAPLLPEVQQYLQVIYLVKGVHSTTAIEGNTLSEDEVMAIFKREATLPESRLYLGQEAQNIMDAMNEAWERPLPGPISVAEICSINARVLSGLAHEDHVVPGQFRTGSVHVGPYLCPPAAEVSRHMDNLVHWYNEFLGETEHLDGISLAIIKAIAIHLYFVLVHPFGDGNGRTARLIEWRTLDHAGVAAPATHLLCNYYNLTRTRYYEMLNRASLGNDLVAFFCYAITGLVEQLSAQLEYIHDQYAKLVFSDMVLNRTPGRGDTNHRRQLLAVAIRKAGAPVLKAEIESLTPELAMEYGGKQERAVSRDLYALEGAGLIENTSQGWVAKTDDMYWSHVRDMRALRLL